MARTAQEELDAVDRALIACETAQQYSTGSGQSKLMAQYEKLCARKDQLEEKIKAENESGGSMASLGTMGGAR